MPLCNERGDVCLTFSGEDFPEPGTVARLRERGQRLMRAILSRSPIRGGSHISRGPERPVPRSAHDDGPGRCSSMIVMGCIGFIITGEGRVLFRGGSQGDSRGPPRTRGIDPRGLGEFVACGCVLENRTLFKGIYVLPPARLGSFERGSGNQETYFQPGEWEDQEILEPESYYQQLREVFSRNLPRYFNGRGSCRHVADRRGLDTRMIMAWHKPPPGSLPCYSFGGMFRDCEDVRVARQVARACGQPHQVISVGKEFLSRFPQYAERTVRLTDGCVAVDHSPDLYVNERAAEIAPVRMTGNYGGEVLRRVRAFKPVQPLSDLFCPEFLPEITAATKTYEGLLRDIRFLLRSFVRLPGIIMACSHWSKPNFPYDLRILTMNSFELFFARRNRLRQQ